MRSNETAGTWIMSNRFMYSKQSERTFIAEASELEGLNFMSQIYYDACDVGFNMMSSKTGKLVKFYLTDTEYNNGDIVCWNFKLCPEYVKIAGGDIKVVIFND